MTDHLHHTRTQDASQVKAYPELNAECLRTKQHCDIHFDHMQGYYGVSSLESLSQGKPVIAGLDDWNIKCIKEFTGSNGLPWIIARCQHELEDKLEALIRDIDMRINIGTKSRNFIEEYWTEQQILESLFQAYYSL